MLLIQEIKILLKHIEVDQIQNLKINIKKYFYQIEIDYYHHR